MLEYLELTFSVMVRFDGKCKIVVLAIEEDYDTLLRDLRRIFNATRIWKMEVV